MAENRLKIDIRREAILKKLRTEGRVSVRALSRELGVTPVTIRNDLSAMELEGSLERIAGGAVPKAAGEPLPEQARYSEAKQQIARRAAALIQDGSTLFVSSGTTSECFAYALREHHNLNVVTNSMAVARALGGLASVRVILLGGEVDHQYGYTCGPDARTQLRRYQAQWTVLSVDGITAREGATSCHADEAEVNRLMIERSANVMIIADHTKVGKAGFAYLCPPGESMTLVTDPPCDKQEADALAAAGVQVIT